MKKRYVPLLIIVISILIIALCINSTNKKTYVYEVDINTNDFMLKDLTMVSSNNSIYILNIYYLEKVGKNEVSDLAISITYNQKEVMSWVLAFDSDIRNDFSELFFKDFSIKPKDEIVFRMKYKANGKGQEFSKSIDLSDCIKYSNSLMNSKC